MSALDASPVVGRKLDSICVTYHRIHENSNGDFDSNGERWFLSALARRNLLQTVFDVGANHGNWASSVLAVNPRAIIHCFELCPPTYEKLSARFSTNQQIVLNAIGLSDSAGEIEVKYCREWDELSSMFEVVCSQNNETIKARVMRGMDYCADRGITGMDLLKVDVEGAEHLVLHGFGNLITPKVVPVIQFEYGMVNIVTKFLLRDYYAYFSDRGYKVGKLLPTSIRFREYRFEDDDFLGLNYIAASPEVAHLLEPNAAY